MRLVCAAVLAMTLVDNRSCMNGPAPESPAPVELPCSATLTVQLADESSPRAFTPACYHHVTEQPGDAVQLAIAIVLPDVSGSVTLQPAGTRPLELSPSVYRSDDGAEPHVTMFGSLAIAREAGWTDVASFTSQVQPPGGAWMGEAEVELTSADGADGHAVVTFVPFAMGYPAAPDGSTAVLDVAF